MLSFIGILLAKSVAIVEKWELKVSASSWEPVIEFPLTFISLMVEFADFLEVSSLITRQVFRILPSFSRKALLKYSSFAALIWLLTKFRCFLNFNQSLCSLVRIALILRMSLSCISFFTVVLIHGDLVPRTRFVLSGACLSAHERNILFHSFHMTLGSWICSKLSQFCLAISLRKLAEQKFFSFL